MPWGHHSPRNSPSIFVTLPPLSECWTPQQRYTQVKGIAQLATGSPTSVWKITVKAHQPSQENGKDIKLVQKVLPTVALNSCGISLCQRLSAHPDSIGNQRHSWHDPCTLLLSRHLALQKLEPRVNVSQFINLKYTWKTFLGHKSKLEFIKFEALFSGAKEKIHMMKKNLPSTSFNRPFNHFLGPLNGKNPTAGIRKPGKA